MSLTTRAWIGAARLRQRLRRRTGFSVVPTFEVRRRWIREHAQGRSFADIGGLFNITGDIALFAESAGASPVTLFDAGNPAFTDFPQKREAASSSVRFVQGDLKDPVSIDAVGVHDIVWCCGVLYHTPNPLLQLMHLRRITKESSTSGRTCCPMCRASRTRACSIRT